MPFEIIFMPKTSLLTHNKAQNASGDNSCTNDGKFSLIIGLELLSPYATGRNTQLTFLGYVSYKVETVTERYLHMKFSIPPDANIGPTSSLNSKVSSETEKL